MLSPPPAIPPPVQDAGVEAAAGEELKQDRQIIPLEIEPEDVAPRDEGVGTAQCTTCGRGLLATDPFTLGTDGQPKCASCGGPGCVPGRKGCNHIEAHTMVGRFFGALYECLCCPDPCYQPSWIPEANAAFFQEFARPQTMTRIRDDNGIDMVLMDRAEFFWAQDNGKGAGPPAPTFTPHHTATTPTTTTTRVFTPPGRPPGLTGPVSAGAVFGRPPGLGTVAAARAHPHAIHSAAASHNLLAQTSLNYNQLSLYQEVATARASFFVEIPYRYVAPALSPTAAGFSDMNLGTKSLLLDCELLQLTFQFKTFLPVGNPLNGLGTGHVSLEPSLLASLRLTPSAYMQGQVAEWIPLGGDPNYAGSLIHYHTSLNQVLYRLTPDSPLIGTMEFNGWSFQGGGYTDPYPRASATPAATPISPCRSRPPHGHLQHRRLRPRHRLRPHQPPLGKHPLPARIPRAVLRRKCRIVRR